MRCFRHVVHVRTKDAMAYNLLWVGVSHFQIQEVTVEIGHVESEEKEHVEIGHVVVKLVVANWAVLDKDSDENNGGDVCAEAEGVADDGIRYLLDRLSCIRHDDASSMEVHRGVHTPLGKQHGNEDDRSQARVPHRRTHCVADLQDGR